MNKIILSLVLLFSITMTVAQTSVEPKPFIEITGTSEIEIVPDQIFISITLQENTDKSKKSIGQQEKDLILLLTAIGIPAGRLVVTDANAHYGKSGFISKDVVNRKQFELEVKDATQAKKAFGQMVKLNIKNAYISRVDHTQMDAYKKKAKITKKKYI